MVFLWKIQSFPMVFLWKNQWFPMVFLWKRSLKPTVFAASNSQVAPRPCPVGRCWGRSRPWEAGRGGTSSFDERATWWGMQWGCHGDIKCIFACTHILYIYIYVYDYICICIYIYICIFLCIHTERYMNIYIYVCEYHLLLIHSYLGDESHCRTRVVFVDLSDGDCVWVLPLHAPSLRILAGAVLYPGRSSTLQKI